MMKEETIHRVGQWITKERPSVVDITGGAPELHPQFRWLVKLSREAGCKVIDRNNLTILLEPGHEDLGKFLASQEVEIIASLPCYSSENVNRQRGNGVFDKSIRALQQLNQLGYGSALTLHLVYNPLGAKLPPLQAELEADYKEALSRDFGIVFNSLFVLTNQPISRFAEDLKRQQQFDSYLELLQNSFNPATVSAVMCRSTVSVGLEGELYDCDFNQMLGLNCQGTELFLWETSAKEIATFPIRTGNHCLACTAGNGSSCTGALT
jgi:radical SAM/Cys-rich protein